MKIIFIRHGEPDKTEIDKRGFIGQGRDMAPLTEQGVWLLMAVLSADFPVKQSLGTVGSAR